MNSSTRYRTAALCFFLIGAASLFSPAHAAKPPEYVKGEVLVKFRQLPTAVDAQGSFTAKMSVLSTGQQSLLSSYKIQGLRRIFAGIAAPSTTKYSPLLNSQVAVPDLYNWCLLSVSTSTDIEALASQLRQDPSVEAAEPNGLYHTVERLPDDTQFSTQWHHKNTGQALGTAGADIRSTFAWSRSSGTASLKIAIVDTGIDSTHPDLIANVIAGTNTLDGNSNTADDYGHGTHVAGIVAATGNNSTGTTGVMWRASLMPVRVCDASGSCTFAAVASGIEWAADNAARIMNISLGGGDSQVVRDAITYALGLGVVVVASAGNDGGETISYPCYYNNVICVAATDRNDQIASFSTRGSWVTIAAPGMAILSTLPTGNCELCDPSSYGELNGTSMASPVVAGVAGLILSVNPAFTAAQVRTRLVSTAENINSLNPSLIGKFGAGRVNAMRAITFPPALISSDLSLVPSSLVNQQAIFPYTLNISSDSAAPQVSVTLVNQFGNTLSMGNTVVINIAGEVAVSGTIQVGALSINYPTTSQVRLKVELNDGIYDVTQYIKTWNLVETAAVPAGGTVAVWNALFDPSKNQKATVRLTLTEAGPVKISIFKRNGRLVKVLADELAGPGTVTWSWAGDTASGAIAASELYLVQIVAPGINVLKKVVLVK